REKVSISLPTMMPFSKEKLLLENQNNNGSIFAAYMTVDGIAELTEALIMIPKKDAKSLMEKFVKSNDSSEVVTDNLSIAEQQSIFVEICTIISTAYFSAVEGMFSLKTNCSVPMVNFGEKAVRDFIKNTLRQDSGVSIRVSFTSEDSNLKGDFLLIPEAKSLGKFFTAIGLG
ncbi:MAG: hypothetical protein HY810_03155, partial [Candidatus Omnitrophica bacterium]|nr:hypothetical protein [Candidatus Omnitrophota bacterium]